jgi:putative restriction endonuclease
LRFRGNAIGSSRRAAVIARNRNALRAFVRRWRAMAEGADSGALSRLRGLGGNPDGSLLALLALGRLAATGDAELPWSVAEVTFADLRGRFGPGDPGAQAEDIAARAFIELSADNFWVLNGDVPADRARVLNERHVSARLDPALEHAQLANPALVRQAARELAASSFPDTEADAVLAAVGLLGVGVPEITPRQADDRGRRRGLDDYLKLTVSDARAQFRLLLAREPAPDGKRQADFIPVETLLCLAASYEVNHRRYGGSTASRAGTPVPELAALFNRRPSSILAKMANLDGSRSHGATYDASAGATLREDPTLFTHVYRVLLYGARAEGIDPGRLPDFLGLLDGGELDLLGQEELADLDPDDLRADGYEQDQDPETERIRLAAARVGQHLFARNVLANCGGACVFCGLQPGRFGARRMLLAGHIKPWRDSTPTERLDTRNGLAACPSHDVAFDTGLLAIEDDLRIMRAARLDRAVQDDELTRHYYGQPPMLDLMRLPADAQAPLARYLAWHRRYVFGSATRTDVPGMGGRA